MTAKEFKFIYITDTHWRENRPKARSDKNYLTTILNDFKNVIDTARKNKVSAILHCGDVFETPNPAFATLLGFSELFNSVDAHVIVTPGQHDYYNHNVETLANSGLHVLKKLCETDSRKFRILSNQVFSNFTNTHELDDTLPEVEIYGFAFDEPVNLPPSSDVPKILMFHKSISFEGSAYESIETVLENLKNTYKNEPILALFGDIHDFETYHQDGNITILAAGAFCVKSIDDFDRTMAYYEVGYNSKDGFKVVRHEVPVASENLATGYKDAKMVEKVKGFLASAELARTSVTESISERVVRIGEASNYSTDSINLVLDYLKKQQD